MPTHILGLQTKRKIPQPLLFYFLGASYQCLSMSPVLQMPHRSAPFIWDELKKKCLPVGVLLRNEEEGVIGGVTGGVRLPLLWRGGVDTFPRDTVLDKVKESFG